MRPILWLACITAFFSISCAGCDSVASLTGGSVQLGSVQPNMPIVKAEPIGSKSEHTYLMTFYGRVHARQTSTLGFEFGGQVDAVLVDDGDRVQKDQELARLDNALLRSERKQLIAEAAVASAVLDKLINGEREEVIAYAQAEANRLQAELAQSERTKERAEQLYGNNAISEEELDAAVFGRQALVEAVEGARQRLSELTAGTRPEDISAQESRLEVIEAQREHLDVRLEKSILRSPFDGVVSRRVVDEGTTVAVGQPVVEVLRDDSFEARFALPIDQVEAAKETKAISIRSLPVPVGRVQVIPRVDLTTRTVEVVIDIDKAYTGFAFHGDACSVELERPLPEGFSVPLSALIPSVRGLWSCYRLVPVRESRSEDEQGIFRVVKEEVSVLHTNGDRVVVQSSLPAGSLVVTEGAQKVAPGMDVRIAGDGA